MEKLPAEIEKILTERFSRDTLIALATSENNMPSVRTVDAYYENGAFYVLTHALSNKMKQIEKNPNVAISGDWFTAKGKGLNMGYFCKKENKKIAAGQLDMYNYKLAELAHEIDKINLDELTPIDALNILVKRKEKGLQHIKNYHQHSLVFVKSTNHC